MERHKCKLCFKSFSNGRALGGHMRSHMLNLAISAKHAQQEVEQGDDQENEVPIQVSQESEFVSSSSSEEEEYDEEKGGSYGLRENPKRSIRLVDPEFSFAVDHANSIVLQDRESETESSKNPTRRRSKRSRKSMEYQYDQENRVGNVKNNVQNMIKFSNSDSVEPEQVSSVSDTTTEEDVAFCLMMLSRDKWKKKESQNQVQKLSHQSFQEFEEEDEEEVEETEDSEEYIRTTIKNNNHNNSRSSGTKGKYKCETCKKVFKSYQALGGHRASHKKLKLQAQIQEQEYTFEQEITVNNNGGSSSLVVAEKKVHECPYCYRVFSSGQALGGHKRSHVIGVSAANVTATLNARISSKFGDNLSFIDLNLPAPVEDDDLSAVSDAEFVNHNQIKR